MSKLVQVYGERIAVKQVTEKREGSIVLPETRIATFELGEVITVGDGKMRDGTTRPVFVRPGDVIMYQLIGPQMENAKFKLNKEPIKIFHQGDVLARITDRKITIETFEIVGNWVLLEVVLTQGTIIVPEKVAPSEDFHFNVKQIGGNVKLPISVGQEVYPERGRCSPILIDGVTYVFINQDSIHGSLAEAETTDDVPSPTTEAPAQVAT